MRTAAFLAALALLVQLSAIPAAARPAAEELINRLGCLSCHSLQGKGGDKAPAWDGVGARRSPEAIRKQIVSPRGRMPSFAQLKPEELQVLVTYLSGLN
ncbi:MAG: c-type cytochrome [Deltaproteobacteria bacterium]|nr:c-type cytochrome [Deltaproteobacteria bacterium]